MSEQMQFVSISAKDSAKPSDGWWSDWEGSNLWTFSEAFPDNNNQ